MHTVKGEVERPHFVDRCLLKSYLDKITSLNGELQGFNGKIFSVEDAKNHIQKASYIEGALFNLGIAIVYLAEQSQKKNLHRKKSECL